MLLAAVAGFDEFQLGFLEGYVYRQTIGQVFVKQLGDAVSRGVIDRPEITNGRWYPQGGEAAVEAEHAFTAVEAADTGLAGGENDELCGGFVFGDEIGEIEGGIGEIDNRLVPVAAVAGMGVKLYKAVIGKSAAETFSGGGGRYQVEGTAEIMPDMLQRGIAAIEGGEAGALVLHRRHAEEIAFGRGGAGGKIVLQVAGGIRIADSVVVQQVGRPGGGGIDYQRFKWKGAPVGRYYHAAGRKGVVIEDQHEQRMRHTYIATEIGVEQGSVAEIGKIGSDGIVVGSLIDPVEPYIAIGGQKGVHGAVAVKDFQHGSVIT